jgi:TonB family protein
MFTQFSAPRTPQHVELPRALPALPTLPAPPEVEVTLLVAGVLSSAPDLDRRASRPEDFAPLPANELAGALLARADVRTADGPRPLAHVDELPIALVGNPRPAYPAMLARARVGGRVVVEFTIDSVGIVAPGSFRVVESTDARFTQAVRAVLPRLRFLPAQLDRHAVGVTVRQPFVFTVRPGA